MEVSHRAFLFEQMTAGSESVRWVGAGLPWGDGGCAFPFRGPEPDERFLSVVLGPLVSSSDGDGRALRIWRRSRGAAACSFWGGVGGVESGAGTGWKHDFDAHKGLLVEAVGEEDGR